VEGETGQVVDPSVRRTGGPSWVAKHAPISSQG